MAAALRGDDHENEKASHAFTKTRHPQADAGQTTLRQV
jgi:hypothetical protein